MWNYKGHSIVLVAIGLHDYFEVDCTELDSMFFDTLDDAKTWIDRGCPVWEGDVE